MDNMEKTLAELHEMLKTTIESIKKNSNDVMMVIKKRKCFYEGQGQGQG
jgi:hypothetical protein